MSERRTAKIHLFTKKLIHNLPTAPRKRFNIFTGTNNIIEWREMAKAWISNKPYDTPGIISEYEKKFAQICGVKHGISFGAGRMALYAILEALKIGNGDEVVIPAFTCVVVPNAILYRGARPVYVDIEDRTFNIDVNKVEAAITSRTRALYAQHTFGTPCDVETIRDIGRRHNLPVIEDGAHALGATYKGKPVGSLTEVAFFSTDHSKVINTHLGGIAVTNDDALAIHIRRLQVDSPFLERKLMRKIIRSFLLEYIFFTPYTLWLGRSIHTVFTHLGLLFFFNDELNIAKPTSYTYPCRMSSVLAQLGLLQLDKLSENLSHRRQIARWLEETIGWYGLNSDQINESTWLRYSFLVKDRVKFEANLYKHFDLGIWFISVVSGRSKSLDAVGYKLGSCPVAEHVVQHIVNFPTHTHIPLEIIQKDVERNLSHIKKNIQYDTFRQNTDA